MNVRPVLGDWEIPRIATLRTLERRAFVELPVPGRTGSLFQDLASAPITVAIAGSLFGDEARDTLLEELRSRFQAGEPVTFVTDITTATEVEYVLIETLRFEQSATRPDETHYYLELTESPPPPPPDPLPGIDAGLLDQAGDFLDSVSGALDVIDGLGSVPDIGDPTPPLTDALGGLQEATAGLEEALGPLRDILGSSEEGGG